MANLQIKGMDDDLYARLKAVAAAENRSVSQEVLFLVRSYLARRKAWKDEKTPGEVLLELAGSWEDEREADEIIAELKAGRRNAGRSFEGF
jgi:plasmid stability protein